MAIARRSAVARQSAAARQGAVATRHLLLACGGVAIGSCGLPVGSPDRSGQPVRAASAIATVAASPSTAPTASMSTETTATIGQVPRIVVRLPPTEASGSTWWVTEAGHPDRRAPIAVPFADLELGPASVDGSILATTVAQALTVRLEGPELVTTSSVPLSVGHPLVPACYAGDGRAVFADAGSLTLVTLSDGVVEPFGAVPFTLGECAALADGRTVVATDGGGLVAVGPEGASTPIVGALGRHLSAGGRWLFMIDPSAEFGEAVVREGTVSEDGSLGAVVGSIADGRAGRIVDARSSPDGRWLAIVLEDGTPTASGARLRCYRINKDGLTAVTETVLEVGARITVLADP